MNNPVNDCSKTQDLLFDEIARWKSLSEDKCNLFASLLMNKEEFRGFLLMVGAETIPVSGLEDLIRNVYRGMKT